MINKAIIVLFICIITVCCTNNDNSDKNVRLLFRINTEIKFVKYKTGHYPSEQKVFDILKEYISKDEIESFNGFKDSWGNVIVYKYPAAHSICDFDLYSIGVNGKNENGDGDDIDVCKLWGNKD